MAQADLTIGRTNAPERLAYRLRKVVRYVRLYGVRRTLAKVKSQSHVNAVESFEGIRWTNPDCKSPDDSTRCAAMIGCGNFAFSTAAYYVAKHYPKFLRSTYDRDKPRSLSLCKRYGGAVATTDWKEIIDDPKVKVVFIASNHASHAEYAIACIEAGKHVHIEKPHAVSMEQLERLSDAMLRNPKSKVFLGFNRRLSPLTSRLQGLMARESGPITVNSFVVGHEIPDSHWYFDPKEGGRVLGNLCHWSDMTLHLLKGQALFPCRIVSGTPPDTKSDFQVAIAFADRSFATLVFSAKGVTFEGVREIFNVHKGDLMAQLTDFQYLKADIAERKVRMRLRRRDHAHEANLLRSFRSAFDDTVPGLALNDVAGTAAFYLAIRHVVETGQTVIFDGKTINSEQVGQ